MRVAKRTPVLLGALILMAGLATAGTVLDIGPYGGLYSGDRTRGFWFTAPVGFTITALRVPDDVGTDPQNIEVLRLFAPPPVYDSTTNDFVSLGYWPGVPGTDWISTSIPVAAGDIIGILGARGTDTMRNSYGQTWTYDTSILGQPITLRRFGMQYNLYNEQAHDVWTEDSTYGRVELQYEGAIIPEPASVVLTLCGLAGLLCVAARRRR